MEGGGASPGLDLYSEAEYNTGEPQLAGSLTAGAGGQVGGDGGEDGGEDGDDDGDDGDDTDDGCYDGVGLLPTDGST